MSVLQPVVQGCRSYATGGCWKGLPYFGMAWIGWLAWMDLSKNKTSTRAPGGAKQIATLISTRAWDGNPRVRKTLHTLSALTPPPLVGRFQHKFKTHMAWWAVHAGDRLEGIWQDVVWIEIKGAKIHSFVLAMKRWFLYLLGFNMIVWNQIMQKKLKNNTKKHKKRKKRKIAL